MRLRSILIFVVAGVSLVFLLLPRILYRIPDDALCFDPFYSAVDPQGVTHTLLENSFLQAFRNPAYAPGLYHITAHLSYTPTLRTSGDYIYLVFPYIAGTAMSVYWNDQFLGSQGDMISGNSNIWNSAKIFTMPASYLQATNTLAIDIQGPYEVGLPHAPYLFLPGPKASLFIGLLKFLSEKIILSIIGALAVLGIVLLLTGKGSDLRPNAMLFLGLASFCTMLFLTDFVTLETLFVPLIEFKRIVAMLRHLAAIFFLIGFSALSGNGKAWFDKLFIALQGLCVVLLLIPRTMIGLKAMYSWTFLTIIPLPMYLTILLLWKKNLTRSHALLVGGVTIASVMSIRDTLLTFLSKGSIYLSHYGFSIMIMAAAGFIVQEILNQNRRLLEEQARAAKFREESVHDPLTGLYNRTILDEIQSTLKRNFSLLVIDINDLKSINDTHGHAAGDAVLKDAAAIMKSLLRNDDIVVRTGGDEFLIILPSSTRSRIDALINDLRARIAASPIFSAGGMEQFFYSVSIGSASYEESMRAVTPELFARLLDSADQEMYSEKENYRLSKQNARA